MSGLEPSWADQAEETGGFDGDEEAHFGTQVDFSFLDFGTGQNEDENGLGNEAAESQKVGCAGKEFILHRTHIFHAFYFSFFAFESLTHPLTI